MGQQQLLLLVIGVVIVGFAVLAGLRAVDENSRQSVADTLVEHNLYIAHNAVAWKTKLDPYNGGNMRYTGLAADGLKTLSLRDSTHTGYFQITEATDDELEITAVSLRYPELGVRTLVRGYDIVQTEVDYGGNITIGAIDE